MFKRKPLGPQQQVHPQQSSKSVPTPRKNANQNEGGITSTRFYVILDYVASRMNVPLQFGTFMKKRLTKDQISEPLHFEHVAHAESEQEAREALSNLIRNVTASKLKDYPTYQRDAQAPASYATGTVVVRNVVDDGLDADVQGGAQTSLATVEKSAAAKIYFEQYFYGVLKKPSGRSKRRLQLENELEGLGLSEEDKREIRHEWLGLESDYMRLLRNRITVNSFHIVKTIGHGAFGVVKLVREKASGKLYAMKVMRKGDMLRKGQEGHIRAERDLLTAAAESATWIVRLIYSFQDADNLYLVMEYMRGGDLLNLLIEKDIFEEQFAKFYAAQMVLCIEETHKFGYIHRDIKPDNFLFDGKGHIKLSDFGLATDFHWAHDSGYYDQLRNELLRKTGVDVETDTLPRIMGRRQKMEHWDDNENDAEGRILTWRDRHRKKMAFSVVGTNNYMAPEVLRGTGYDGTCDWWSFGVILFEMLYGYPPFSSKTRHATRLKIVNWRQTLRFPARPRVSREAQDLMERLICEREDRLGSRATSTYPNSLYATFRRTGGNRDVTPSDADEIKAHPWFRGIEWAKLHKLTPPFQPKFKNETDTRYFDEIVDDKPLAPPEGEVERKPKDPMLRDRRHGVEILEMRKQLAFVGYTYRGLPVNNPRGGMAEGVRGRALVRQQQLRLRSMSL